MDGKLFSKNVAYAGWLKMASAVDSLWKTSD